MEVDPDDEMVASALGGPPALGAVQFETARDVRLSALKRVGPPPPTPLAVKLTPFLMIPTLLAQQLLPLLLARDAALRACLALVLAMVAWCAVVCASVWPTIRQYRRWRDELRAAVQEEVANRADVLPAERR